LMTVEPPAKHGTLKFVSNSASHLSREILIFYPWRKLENMCFEGFWWYQKSAQ